MRKVCHMNVSGEMCGNPAVDEIVVGEVGSNPVPLCAAHFDEDTEAKKRAREAILAARAKQ